MEIAYAGNRLEGRIALITGAGRGIGRAIALRFADEGADVFLCATSIGPLRETLDLVIKRGRRAEAAVVDVTDRDAVKRMVDRALDCFERIDILVNNAGILKMSKFVDYSPEDFDRTMQVNVYGPFHVTQFVLRHMLASKRDYKGKIVNMGSTAGKWSSPNQSAYNISKHALVGMTRCLGLELARENITVNAICPSAVETEMIGAFAVEFAKILGSTPEEALKYAKERNPMGRMVQPDEVAGLAVYLASSESDAMTGQSILMDGGTLVV